MENGGRYMARRLSIRAALVCCASQTASQHAAFSCSRDCLCFRRRHAGLDCHAPADASSCELATQLVRFRIS